MRRALVALAALLLAAAAPPPSAAPGAVRLAPAKRLVRGANALPQIAAPATPATARINADLRRQDRVWLEERAGCMGQGKGSSVERNVTVAMAGPAFLAVEIRHDLYCAGAAHPNQFPGILVYDVAAGRPVNWARLIRGVTQSDPPPEDSWGDTSARVAWPAAHKLYVAKVRAGSGRDRQWWGDCGDLVSDSEGEFYVWPDAKRGGLVLEPSWMPHVAQVCAESVVFTPADLRGLGADRRLIEAFAPRQP